MLSIQHHGIPAHRDKEGIDSAGYGRREDVGDLEGDKEGKGQDNGGVSAVAVVRRVGEEHVEVGKESASVRDGEGAEREDRSD